LRHDIAGRVGGLRCVTRRSKRIKTAKATRSARYGDVWRTRVRSRFAHHSTGLGKSFWAWFPPSWWVSLPALGYVMSLYSANPAWFDARVRRMSPAWVTSLGSTSV